MISTFAVVRFTQSGFHHWQNAPDERAYLAQSHRHLFHLEVKVEVKHMDREIEYHDLLDYCHTLFPGGDMGGKSCEHMAAGIVEAITRRWERRRVMVSVFEDGEVGAELSYWPQ